MIYTFFRWLGMILGYPIQWLFFKRKIYYEDKKNNDWKKGGKLIIGNHYNMFDYPLVAFMVFPRQLIAVASEMPFKSSFARFGMKFFGTIQANRETKDMSFIEKSAEAIYNGKLVQIFPEAKNTPDGKIHDFKPSYVLIADMADCNIVPVISDGNFGLFKRTSIIIGKEIHLSEIIGVKTDDLTKEEINLVNQVIHKKALDLREKLDKLKNQKKK